MKSKPIDEIDGGIINQDLFGLKYKIDQNGVDILLFTPIPYQHDSDKSTYLRHRCSNVNQFRVHLVSPFFLPLQSSLSGLYEQLLFHIPEILYNHEHINIIWLFQKRSNWKELAISMYESYLKGNNYPSDIEIIRKITDKVLNLKQKISPQLEQREYSIDVEKKILDDGYAFQCVVEIQSNRPQRLASSIQDILSQYSFHNSLRLEWQEYQYPYMLYPTSQLLSKSEIHSLFNRSRGMVDIEENREVLEKIKSNNNVDWSERIKFLPKLEKNLLSIDESLVSKLADSLKRVGVINQARLYNESIEYGSRLNVVHADLPKGKNFSDIVKKQKDIQVALGVQSLSISQGDKPGTVKFSIPHNQTQAVSLREIIERDDFKQYSQENDLAFIVGFDEINNPIYLSLRELRHILIVGSQGSGKSVFVNQLLTTLLITHTPDKIKFIMIDPKQTELAQYEQFPHVGEVITDMRKAMRTFNGLINEMENRYALFKENKVKDIWGYNAKKDKPKEYMICVVEEWADLVATTGKDAENVVLRLGQKARAAGIFLIIVTQRPSAKILSGDIKANIQSKFSFNLGNNTNYRTVFDQGIPFQLLGKGDGVFSVEGYPKEFQRFQSPIITTNTLEEESIYEELAKTYEHHKHITQNTVKHEGLKEIDLLLNKLKSEIAKTRETKVTVLREKLQIKTETLTVLMNRLVDEGWLIRHKSKSKGYELIIDENTLNIWRDR